MLDGQKHLFLNLPFYASWSLQNRRFATVDCKRFLKHAQNWLKDRCVSYSNRTTLQRLGHTGGHSAQCAPGIDTRNLLTPNKEQEAVNSPTT